MAKKKTAAVSNWLDTAEEVPRENTVAFVDRSKRQRFYRRFIVAAIILLPISLGTNVLAFGQMNRGAAVVVEQFTPSAEGKAAAILAVRAWLAQDISPLPGGGFFVSWDGADLVIKPVQTEAQSKSNPVPAFDIEIHHFTVVDGTGLTYSTDVSVAIDPESGAHVMSSPSAIPNAPATDGGSAAGAGPWFGLSSAAPPKSVTDAITAWAKVYTSGDPDALRLAVQDSDGQHTYVPLSNVADHSITVTRSAFLPDSNAEPGTPVISSSKMIVQVTLSIRWVGAAIPQPGDKAPSITLDLLILNADGAAPIVVAWGGPGSGPTLTAYVNALNGRSIGSAGEVADTTETDSPNPTSTPTSTPTGGPDSLEGDQ
jgi:hypothetical protein